MTQVEDISVIICAYTEKRWSDLVAAVQSVQRQTMSAREIILVVDHNPNLLTRARKQLSGVMVIGNNKAKGLSGARNSGWAVAQGEIVAFLDDDAIAQPNWLEDLAACYTEPCVAGVGGKIIPKWEASRPLWFPDEFNWVIGCTYRGIPIENTRLRNVIGANMSIRKSILAAVGGFRESFGCDKDTGQVSGALKLFSHYAGDEETEFCIRVTQQLPGSVWVYAATAAVQHRVSVERACWRYFLWRCYDEGLGKADLARLHGTQSGLSSEKTYAFKVLPKGIALGLTDTLFHHEPAGLARAGAIVIGLITTMAGYLVGRIFSQITAPGGEGKMELPRRRIACKAPPHQGSLVSVGNAEDAGISGRGSKHSENTASVAQS